LLDQFDETQSYANWHWPDSKIDLFKDYGEPGQRSLLQQLQQSILDLEPIPADPVVLSDEDDSLDVSYCPIARNVRSKILHDHCLARFNAAEKKRQSPIST